LRFGLTVVVLLTLVGLSEAVSDNGLPECQNLKVIDRLARLEGSGDAAMIKDTKDKVCTLIEPPKTVDWPNRRRAQLQDGRWRYPSLRVARDASGRWRYPSSRIAKEADGRWRYPNTRVAKEADGTWRRPDGSRATLDELIDWACTRLGPSCGARADILNAADDDERDVAVVEWAWRAEQAPRK
jgi:hypothetical protein